MENLAIQSSGKHKTAVTANQWVLNAALPAVRHRSADASPTRDRDPSGRHRLTMPNNTRRGNSCSRTRHRLPTNGLVECLTGFYARTAADSAWAWPLILLAATCGPQAKRREGMMRAGVLSTWMLSAALAATLMSLEVSQAQQPPAPPYKMTPLMKAPFTADPSKETVMIKVEWPANVSAPWHTHPGDEYATVIGGSIITQIEGAEPKTVTVGQSYHIPPGVVHIAKTGEQPATTINLFVVEKGKPLLQPTNK